MSASTLERIRLGARKALLCFESCLTVPIFIGSWLVCAIGFSAMAGFQMAKADSAAKEKILDKALGGEGK